MSDHIQNLDYHWIDDWGRTAQSKDSRLGWAHPGMATTRDGRLVTCDSGESVMKVFNPDGVLLESWNGSFVDAHGITITSDDVNEEIWIADNGSKRHINYGYDYAPDADETSGRVFKVAFGGKELLELPFPQHDAYKSERYAPTSVAVNEKSYGGNGDVWVADGYGASLVHRYSAEGSHLGTIDGTEGAGHFDCPHGIFMDRRKIPTGELYVADRANARVQVFDMEGRFKRSFGSNFLNSPSAFATFGDVMVVAELQARLALIDVEDRLINYLFPDEQVAEREGWPNEKSGSGEVERPATMESGKFNSPHGLTVDNQGNIYVAEWLIGGRMVKLVRG